MENHNTNSITITMLHHFKDKKIAQEFFLNKFYIDIFQHFQQVLTVRICHPPVF